MANQKSHDFDSRIAQIEFHQTNQKMKNKNIKMKTIEWIAMIWTLPIAIVVLALFGVISLFHTLFRFVFYYSGTAGAAFYIASTMRTKMSNFEWAKIARDDHRSHQRGNI